MRSSSFNLTSDLTRDQQNAVKKLLHFCDRKNAAVNFLLTGSAGTGKSYLIGAFLQMLNEMYPMEIVVTAPTNQAVGVLEELLAKFKIKNVDCMTVYRLLGLQVSEGEGEEVLLKEKASSKNLDFYPEDYSFVIVDEASMIDEDLWEQLRQKTKNAKKIFIGDEAQLLPVKNKAIPVLKIKEKVVLKEIVRQAANSPLTPTISQCRNLVYSQYGEFSPICSSKPDKTSGVWVCDQEKWLETAIRAFSSPKAQDDLTHSKIITFRNVTADSLNLKIRQTIIDSGDSYIPGEILITKDAIFSSDRKYVIVPVGAKIVVDKATPDTLVLEHPFREIGLAIWNLKVEYGGKKIQIAAIDPKDQSNFETALQELANTANEIDKKVEKYSEEWIEVRNYWRSYWKLKKTIYNVSYRYTQTVRRSQGRSYKNVFICTPDFLNIPDPDNRWRCLYVAVSRASEKLFFLPNKDC